MGVFAQRDILGDAKGCIEFFVAVVLDCCCHVWILLIGTVVKFIALTLVTTSLVPSLWKPPG